MSDATSLSGFDPSVAGRRGPLAYFLLVVLPVAGVLGVLYAGRGLVAPAENASGGALFGPVPLAAFRVPVFLAQIVVVVVLARLVGRLVRRVRQPQIAGEMLAGILLGPSVLGLVWPEAYAALFPLGSVRFLNAVAQLGLLLFMFIVGLELDLASLRVRSRAAVLASHTSIVMPLFLGVALSLLLYPRLSSAAVPFASFALFVGTALSVTAFPVLARLLVEHGIERTPLGQVAIACAAVDDVTAWCLLAFITAFAHPDQGGLTVALAFLGLVAHVAAMILVVRPLLARRLQPSVRDGALGPDAFAFVIAVALGSAWVTEALGVHALFGAFLAGAVMPRDASFVRGFRERNEDLLLVVLLPLFFVSSGIRTNVALLAGYLPLFLLTLFVAVAGKMGGATIAMRMTGTSWREGLMLGTLLNARGLIGLVVLNVGYEARVISPAVYTTLVCVALATTFMTSPILTALRGRGPVAAP